MRFRINAFLLVALIAALPLFASCGSDSSTGPGGGGGNLGLNLPAGSYLINFSSSACPVPNLTTGGGGFTFEYIVCNSTTWSELLEVTCPVTGDDTNLSVDCTFTDDNGLCSTTYRVQGTGTKSGNTWTINGMSEITAETPPGCSGDPACEQVTITVTEQSAGAPSACQYGDANTVSATVTGGPLGSVEMLAGGFPTVGAGGVAWNINAFYDASGGSISNLALNLSYMNMSIPEISPAQLPISFGISVIGPGIVVPDATPQAGGQTALMGYSETYLSGGGFYAEGVSSGTLTVHEVSESHIAGTYNVNFTGTEFTPPATNTTSTRGLTGQFHVRETPIVTSMRYAPWPGLAKAMKMARE